MSNYFLGEVQLFGFDFAPNGWATCSGQTLAIQQNAALFSLLGVNYGGNGTSTYQLPNLASRAAIGQGTGPNLTPRFIGEPLGENSITLVLNEIPPHGHAMTAYTGGAGQSATPVAGVGFGSIGRGSLYSAAGTAPDTLLSPLAIGPAGSNQAHENRQPLLALNYCIALQGNFPQFS